jgi:hypothetical protein
MGISRDPEEKRRERKRREKGGWLMVKYQRQTIEICGVEREGGGGRIVFESW